jgi:hypothetical protein
MEVSTPVIGKARTAELATAIMSLEDIPSLAAILALSEVP